MTRPAHIWLAFTLCAAVLMVVMGWVSRTTLHLDRLQADATQTAEVEERARLALWRLDSSLASILIEESARGYAEYEAFAPAPWTYRSSAGSIETDGVLIPSALLRHAPSQVLLHFQLHADGRVTSPQVPVGRHRQLAEASQIPQEQLERAARRLSSLQRILAQPAAATSVTQVASSTDHAAPDPVATFANGNNAAFLMMETKRPWDLVPAFGLRPRTNAPAQTPWRSGTHAAAGQLTRLTEQQQFRNETEFNFRANTFQEAQQRLSLQNSLQQDNPPQTPASLPETHASGGFRAVWLGEALVLARRVNLDPDFVIQGCWLDWTSLRHSLLDSIRDLFPEADLEPATRRSDALHARRLAALPVQLLTSSPPLNASATWTPLRLALALAWVCVLIAGLAVASLMHGTLSLSERRAAFVSAVTHELRTPLTTFKMYSEMLAEGMVKDETTRRGYLATLCAEANRLTHLVENVLAYARLERTTAHRRHEPIALGELLECVTPRLLERAGQAGLTLAMPEDEQVRRAVVRVDITTVEQILFNLVDNACKYAAPTANDRTLHLEARPNHRRFVVLRMRDHGPGLTPTELDRLFQPFAKSAQVAAESASGVGLGLALSRRLSRELGGDLRLDRRVKDGAAFLLLLPLDPRTSSVPSSRSSPHPGYLA